MIFSAAAQNLISCIVGIILGFIIRHMMISRRQYFDIVHFRRLIMESKMPVSEKQYVMTMIEVVDTMRNAESDDDR